MHRILSRLLIHRPRSHVASVHSFQRFNQRPFTVTFTVSRNSTTTTMSTPIASTTTTTPTPSADVEMEVVYSCSIYGLSGWDSAAKVEKRLKEHGIQFQAVAKRKGVREDTGTIFFDSEQQMKEMIDKMNELREAPTNKPVMMSSTPTATAAASSPTVATPTPSPDPSPAPPNQTRQLFKVRPGTVTTRKKRSASPRLSKGQKQKEFRPAAKRIKIELKEGEVGYAEAAAEEEAKSESEGEEKEGTASGGPRSGRISPTLIVERTINDVVAPLWRKPYAEQLVIKRNGVRDLIQQTTKNWQREYKELTFPYGTSEPSAQGNKLAPLFSLLDDIVPSPIIDAYRNKCEFSIGLNSLNQPSIGHLMGKYTEGQVTVESVDGCPHVPAIAKSLSRTLLDFITANQSEYSTYDKTNHTGFWRLVTVRNSQETKQVMILVQVQATGKTDEQMNDFRKRLIQHFRSAVIDNAEWKAQNENYDLKSIQLQLFDGISNAAPEGTPIELLYGDSNCITERLMGLEFRVSQAAFFQINVPQTNTLYSIAADFAALPPVDAPQALKDRTTLLDVCCGTGTIGLSLANRVGKIVGLELSASAIEDAKYNAAKNGVTNAFYYVGRAEDTLSTALADHVSNLPPAAQSAHTVTAIVDPPRSGLHSDVVRLLRKCARIDRIVYVSCNPKSLMENLQRFVQPPSKKWVGQPFTIVRARPVDMFPHTDHCEMVVLLERTRPVEAPKPGATNRPVIKQFAHQLPAAAASSTTTTTATAASEPTTTTTPTN